MKTSKIPSLRRPARLMLGTLLIAGAGMFTLTAAEAAPGGHHGGGPGHEMRGDGLGGVGGGMGGGMGGRGLERMLDSVNATAEQRSQIQAIAQAARAEMKTQHDAARALRQQEQQLFAQPTVDARAAETLRQQKMALHEQASKRMLQVKLDISRVLTPEQRKAMADRMAQRSAMMERHRAERGALEGARRN